MSESKQAEPLLRVEHLKQYFPTKVKNKTIPLKAVDDVSFEIYPGEILGLVGESGCGKSTVGRTILGLNKPTSGKMYFKGKKLNLDSLPTFRRNMQMVFQDPYSSLNPRMKVADIIGEPLDVYHDYKNKEERMEKIYELMDLVDLTHEQANRYAHEFSGGQRQRIGIARAIALKPDFLVCDEPVSALDVSIQAQVINMFRDLRDKLNMAYLFISHDLLVVKHISDRIAVMYLGQLMELADAGEIYEKPVHPYTQSLLSAIPVPDPEIARSKKPIIAEGEIPSPLNMPKGCPFSSRCRYCKDICKEQVPHLKDIGGGHYVACHLGGA